MSYIARTMSVISWKTEDMWGDKDNVKNRKIKTGETYFFVNVTVSVNVVEVESPLQLLCDGAPQQDGQSCYEVLMKEESNGRKSEETLWRWMSKDGAKKSRPNLKLYGSCVSCVKCIEQIVRIRAGICRDREKLRETKFSLFSKSYLTNKWKSKNAIYPNRVQLPTTFFKTSPSAVCNEGFSDSPRLVAALREEHPNFTC